MAESIITVKIEGLDEIRQQIAEIKEALAALAPKPNQAPASDPEPVAIESYCLVDGQGDAWIYVPDDGWHMYRAASLRLRRLPTPRTRLESELRDVEDWRWIADTYAGISERAGISEW